MVFKVLNRGNEDTQNDEKRLQYVWYYVQIIVQNVLHLRQYVRNHREVPSYAVSPAELLRRLCILAVSR